jgi:hypothetical protein
MRLQINDEQAESLSNVHTLLLPKLSYLTKNQAESLSKVESLSISGVCRKLMDEYKNQPGDN